MRKRITLVGLAALCALAFGAISASGASAAATAYTCVDGAGAHNTNSHCVPGSFGTYGHVAIAPNTSTAVTVKGLESQVVGSEEFGAAIELIATEVECIGCTGENKEVGGVMEVTGSGGRARFTGVTVGGSLGANCTVVEDSVAKTAHVITTEPLKFTTTSTTSATIEPVTPTTLATFEIVTNPAAHAKLCNIKGTYVFTGDVSGTLSGATMKFNVTTASGTLKLNGNPASFKGEITIEAGSGATRHAIALT